MKNEKIVNKIVQRINNDLKRTDKPLIIAIGGCGASGKTHLSLELLNKLGKKDANILNIDGYYYDRDYRRKLNITGCNINSVRLSLLKKHLMNIKKRKIFRVPEEKVNKETSVSKDSYSPKRVNIVDGLASMFKPFIKLYDITIFIECSDKTQLERRIRRDKNKRNLSLKEIKVIFNHRNNEFKKHLLPQKRLADFILYSQKDFKLKEV